MVFEVCAWQDVCLVAAHALAALDVISATTTVRPAEKTFHCVEVAVEAVKNDDHFWRVCA